MFSSLVQHSSLPQNEPHFMAQVVGGTSAYPFSLLSASLSLASGSGRRDQAEKACPPGGSDYNPAHVQEQDAGPPSGTSVGSLGTQMCSVCWASCDLPASPPHLLLPNFHPTDSNSWGVVSPADCLQERCLRRMAPTLPPLPSSVYLGPQGRVIPAVLGRDQAELL